MERISKAIAKHSKLILLLAIILVIPAAFGYFKTDVNYDILSYLPEETSTMQAEKILKDDFGCGSVAMLIVEDMPDKDVAKIKEKVAKLDGVKKALWVDDFIDLSVPKEILPKDMTDLLYNGDKSTMIIVMLKEGTATLTTQNTVQQIRNIVGKQGFLSGMSGIIKDTKDCADGEMPLYVIIAAVLTLIVLLLTMESTVVPFVFLLSIALAIIYNFGSNIILGEISYITKALAAVLQLGVTMDYSIFLLHRYDEELERTPDRIDAMSNAIQNTFVSIIGSSTTTVAGFLALCAMDLTLGMDMGIVMAKGVIIGVLCTVTILPSLILIFDGPIHKYKHRTILPAFEKTSNFVVKHYKKLAVLFIIIFIPAFIGNNKAEVYYNLDESLPDDFPSIIATNKMKDDYNMESTDFILISDKLDSNDVSSMIKELEKVDGVNSVIGLEKYIGPAISQDIIPDEILSELKAGGYEEMMLNSKYRAASDECNAQLTEIEHIVHKYDPSALVGGEAPLTKDLIRIADSDFKKVSAVSIIAIFVIITIVFKSVSLPVILVAAIECAIFANLGIPYYTGKIEPFIASIVLGTIQLGATVDYAILMTSRFKEELEYTDDKFEAMRLAIKHSAGSIMTSALSFFSATIGVGVISQLELIGSLCSLMSRGAIISMFMIIFILPGLLLVFEPVIRKTSKGFEPDKKQKAATDAVN
ncbi:efflux RND transporter permease subunit [Intestinibacter bartlettii]|uniref:MMPL family transporter n=1 Tax=Intestinibacter bartlettii TaxID=261299 RepID=A0ABS6E031_9FIRM|nr:MMPL family transporter [Intestinibacter bartlettii]MBU5337008.1 MMPL family transporter [Intestinibacter bartlettii]MDO5011204.1 MMPL family transporter [Intestinibacter bartlettii]